MTTRYLLPLLTCVLMLACGSDDATAPGANESATGVAIKFGIGGTSTSASLMRPRIGVSAQTAGGTSDSLVIDGTNGTLVIKDVSFVVSEFELKRSAVDCDSVTDEDACEKFTAPPAFVDLPLGGGGATAVSQPVEAGTYSELKFEVENIEMDEDDSAEARRQIDSLFASIRGRFADWPRKASMVVEGTFTPTGGAPVPFRTYFEAEIEVEKEFEPAITLGEADSNRSLSVVIEPGAWFKRADGRVVDLSALDYAKTGELVEFELEMESGFKGVRDDKHHDHDDD
jgi:hypothetical protein